MISSEQPALAAVRASGACMSTGAVFACDACALDEDCEMAECEWTFRIGYGVRLSLERDSRAIGRIPVPGRVCGHRATAADV